MSIQLDQWERWGIMKKMVIWGNGCSWWIEFKNDVWRIWWKTDSKSGYQGGQYNSEDEATKVAISFV